MVGLGWLALNCATYVVLGLYKRHHYTRLKQTGHGIGFIENCLTVPLIIALCVATGEFKLSGVTAATIPGVAPHTATPFHAFTELQLATKLAVAGTSLFAASMNIVYVNLFRLLPATAITVLAPEWESEQDRVHRPCCVPVQHAHPIYPEALARHGECGGTI
jgi:hypothetical protein